MPRRLSQTGAFDDVRNLKPHTGLTPYDLNVSFWSDGAVKQRWISVPNDSGHPLEKVHFQPTGEWGFPPGTVLVKHFAMPIDETHPSVLRRLETRLIVCDATGAVYGVTYKWRPDNSDADLLTTNLSEAIPIKTATGVRTQTWYYPSRQDCRVCHTDLAGGVLGVKTRQMNREVGFYGNSPENQLLAWSQRGLLEPSVEPSDLAQLPRLAGPDDLTRSLEDRARSYLDVNCAQCHRPHGTVAYFDARYDTPLARQELVEGPLLIDQGIDRARVIAPHDIWRSIALMRANSLDSIKMPPLAHETIDVQGMALLREWIQSLPGRDVLSPPRLSPGTGEHRGPIQVSISQAEPEVEIRYTLDGSVPTRSDLLYHGPITITEPTTVRAKAFKPGFTRSITVQATYVPTG